MRSKICELKGIPLTEKLITRGYPLVREERKKLEILPKDSRSYFFLPLEGGERSMGDTSFSSFKRGRKKLEILPKDSRSYFFLSPRLSFPLERKKLEILPKDSRSYFFLSNLPFELGQLAPKRFLKPDGNGRN